MAKRLSEHEIQNGLKETPNWSVRDGKLYRAYSFKDFQRAFGFLSQVALISEQLNHHAEIFNCYGKVELRLNTHDVAGISERDFKWAKAADLITD